MAAGRFLLIATALCALAMPLVQADLYLHAFDGSNNRLNEQNRDRQNGNRLFDSQNNNRGGRNTGTYGRMYYYTTSKLRVEWTNQHACANPNVNCEFVLQYYCDANVTRDGKTTNRIPDIGQQDTTCYNANCDQDTMYGRHESMASYQQCKWRERNKGLYTSTQDMSNGRNGAIFTRQNNNGDRYGYECPEERDYYPYWHPTVWRDIAVITNDTQRCAAWQAESENVKPRSYCKVSDAFISTNIGTNLAQPNKYGFVPNNKVACEDALVGGVWTEVPAHNIPAPECVQAPWTRDNHLGNVFGGETAYYEWTVPDNLADESCVFRMRYNMSSSETRDAGEYFTSDSVVAGSLNATMNYRYRSPPQGINIDQNNDDVTAQNPRFYKWADQVDVWSKYGMSKQEQIASFDPKNFYSDEFMKLNPSRGYVFRNDPVVDIFGSLLARSTLPQDNQPLPTVLIPLRLSLDTSQYSRTFEDRTHTFTIRKRSSNAGLAASTTVIHNVGVRGKRGNIVQVYPSVEYDFTPNTLSVNQGDWIHFQWTGSNTNPNNDGQPAAQTDRSNIVVLRAYGNPWSTPEQSALHGPFSGTRDGVAVNHTSNWKLSYPSRIDSTGIDFLGMTFAQKKILAKNGIYSPYFDMPPVQALNAGTFNYLCTRNNAFTNRGQKAQIIVNAMPNAAELVVSATTATARLISASGASWIRYAPDPLGQTTNTQLNIQELSDGRLLVTPFTFDVVPGQKVMLDMTYSERPLTNVYVYQSDSSSYKGDEMTSAMVANGVASVSIVRGGYYHIEQPAAGSAVAGVVIGVVAALGLAGFGYYKLKSKFHIRDKKHIALAQEAHSP